MAAHVTTTEALYNPFHKMIHDHHLVALGKNADDEDYASFLMLMEQQDSIVEHRDLAPSSCSSCPYLFFYYGYCGAFTTDSSNWGYYDVGSYSYYYDSSSDCDYVCCAYSEFDCCDPNPGVIAGVVIGFIALIVFIVIASCACCSCCPWYQHLCCSPSSEGAIQETPVQAVVPPDAKAMEIPSSLKTTSINQDGSTTVTTEITNPDGSKTVTVKTEEGTDVD